MYVATVVLLTDNQLHVLGLTSMGEIATVRAACNAVQPMKVDKTPGPPPIDVSLEQVELMRDAMERDK